MPRRKYRDNVELSFVGFGGMIAVGMEQSAVDALVAQACASGVNYFDVAPLYGDGEAEHKLGIALAPYRDRLFLACKTLERTAPGAAKELERSLRRLQTGHLDLYQFHSVGKKQDMETIFGPGGAAEALVRARDEGKIRYLGFSSHSVPIALEMLDRFEFDSILFPVNFACWQAGGFGPQVLEKCRGRGVPCIALKVMADGRWRKGEAREYPNCWYRPIGDRALARAALRFAFSEGVTAILPPGDARLFRLALELAPQLEPLDPAERADLMSIAGRMQPLLRVSS